jgi:hypothetical protein
MNDSQQPGRFIPGLQLARYFFEQVRPILNRHWPDLQYAAALIGAGSEVLGFDDETSTDHHWGPRAMLFLSQADYTELRQAIQEACRNELPAWCRGYPTNFSAPDPDDDGTQLLQPQASGPVNHRVEAYTLHGFFAAYLNVAIEQELDPIDWLTLPQQKLRSITAGAVFHDDLGLHAIRSRLAFYPHDVWLYMLASAWTRISQEEHLMGRAGTVGDELGSALIAGRLVRDVMRLAFLMEKDYAPYPKWFGTAFARLECASRFDPILASVIHADSWQEREEHLCMAYEVLADMHNALGITEPLPSKASSFWGRPFRVIHGERFAQALQACISDPRLKALAANGLVGNIDLMSDNTDCLEAARLRPDLKGLLCRLAGIV